MLAEWRGLEYVFEILRMFHCNPGRNDTKEIIEFIQSENRISATLSYMQKILPRMVKAGLLLHSSGGGYRLHRPINEIMVNEVLEICTMPETNSPLHKVCNQLKSAVSLSSIDEFYDFSCTVKR